MKHGNSAAIAFVACMALSSLAFADGTKITGQGTWEMDLVARDLNGDGLADAYFDRALNITWTAQARDSNEGALNWTGAVAWASSLNVYGVTGWRLPHTFDVGNDGCNYGDKFLGMGKDCGFQPAPASSELAHMYYVTLGNKGDDYGNHTHSWFENSGPFSNIVAQLSGPHSGVYWSDTTLVTDAAQAWLFSYYDGWQNADTKSRQCCQVWAVHDGAVTAVAEPASWALLLAGLGLVGCLGRRSAAARVKTAGLGRTESAAEKNYC